MNDFFRKQGVILGMFFVTNLVVVVLAYGTLQQSVAVQDQKLMAIQQELDASNARITNTETQLRDTATKTDIQNLRGDIRDLGNALRTFYVGKGNP